MHRKFTRLAWFTFAVLACASWYAYFFLTGVPGLLDALFGMALLNVVIGVWIINYASHRRRTVLLVAAAFLAGHYGALLWGSAFLLWHLRGFAP